jgi:hypothetical protein
MASASVLWVAKQALLHHFNAYPYVLTALQWSGLPFGDLPE